MRLILVNFLGLSEDFLGLFGRGIRGFARVLCQVIHGDQSQAE